MKISVIGTGYVGLVSGACFADLGHSVTCLDNNKSKIRSLSKAKTSIYEPGLENMLARNLKKNKLSFTTSYSKACQADLLLLCIDTPASSSGNPNLGNLNKAMRSIADVLKKDLFIAIKSTVPVGTNQHIADFFNAATQFNVNIISNPEFLKEGSAIEDFLFPARIIIGHNSLASRKKMQDLYAPLNLPSKKIIFMNIQSAELTKYAANSFLATKISFINKMSQIADQTNADILEVQRGIGSDPRIGNEFLNAGLGYGGSCFPKDIKALISIEKKLNLENSLFKVVEAINDQQFHIFYNKIIESIGTECLSSMSLMFWGLSFKPNTDDVRDSISLKLIHKFSKKVNKIYVYDPQAIKTASNELKKYKNIIYCKTAYDQLKHANALVLCTEWDEFLEPDLERLKQLKNKKIFDGRNCLNKEMIDSAGLEYIGLGV